VAKKLEVFIFTKFRKGNAEFHNGFIKISEKQTYENRAALRMVAASFCGCNDSGSHKRYSGQPDALPRKQNDVGAVF
jgi:hypothetical protein